MKGLVFSNKIFVGVGFSALLLMTSCATNASYEKILNTWVGAPADALIYSWGPPHEEYTYTGGHRQIVYSHQDSRQIETLAYYVREETYKDTGVKGYRTYILDDCDCYYGTPKREYGEKITFYANLNLWCETRFAINPNGIITKWKWSGNYCVAPLLASLFNKRRYPPNREGIMN
jgi:hypothetical protein